MGNRAVIYARYSSDLQSDASIEDQERVCREYAKRHGFRVIGVYGDRAISGAHLKTRPEVTRLLADARAKHFDVVIAEALDRISRNIGDVAGIYERFVFSGVELHTVADGKVNELHVGLKGTMNALFLKDLADKVRRGQTGRIAAGFSAGGLSYGYDVKQELDKDGEVVRGLRVINEEQANVVRRIFREYVAGRSARAIARDLNRDRIPSPMGGEWQASTINGNLARGYGILASEIYVGRVVFNRITMTKDPETGKRISRPNPKDKWQIVEMPHLRIVDDELWDAAQAKKARYRGLTVHHRRRPRHLFSGLVRCGVCGSGYTVKYRDRLCCTGHKEKGTCQNGHTITVRELERRVLAGLKDKLLDPDKVAEFAKTYVAERKALAGKITARKAQIEKRLRNVEREAESLVDSIAQGRVPNWDRLNNRLEALEQEKRDLLAEQAELQREDRVVDFHPGKVEAYRRALDDLRAALTKDEATKQETVEVLRRLVQAIEIHPGTTRGEVKITALGLVAEVLNLARRKEGEALSTALVVAGEGLEPPTLGL